MSVVGFAGVCCGVFSIRSCFVGVINYAGHMPSV